MLEIPFCGGVSLEKHLHEFFLHRAIDLAVQNVKENGGPFGAVITRNNQIIAEGVNRVTSNLDPTAHAEVMAIRKACQSLQTFELTDCILYSSCEPCPMCLGAIYWSRIPTVYFAADRKDAASIHFDDEFIYREVQLDPANRTLPFIHLPLVNSLQPFMNWRKKVDRTHY
ncbi:nucleoside deaminase [Sutcliffiella horikoshii]|uniref:nucleoside deaminase n=1 Tax=Sutcliffiella horikoshii TaxID=79883 RepID=UPI001CBDDB8A|nr:nucleoside deaminase [Sutcliffiella horikoshii]UAL49324.1 nucleoside deaminase [Sutcliffiella horikoshii]